MVAHTKVATKRRKVKDVRCVCDEVAQGCKKSTMSMWKTRKGTPPARQTPGQPHKERTVAKQGVTKCRFCKEKAA